MSDAHIIIMWDVVSFDIFNRAHWKSVESELRPGEVEIKSFQLTPENVVSCCPPRCDKKMMNDPLYI